MKKALLILFFLTLKIYCQTDTFIADLPSVTTLTSSYLLITESPTTTHKMTLAQFRSMLLDTAFVRINTKQYILGKKIFQDSVTFKKNTYSFGTNNFYATNQYNVASKILVDGVFKITGRDTAITDYLYSKVSKGTRRLFWRRSNSIEVPLDSLVAGGSAFDTSKAYTVTNDWTFTNNKTVNMLNDKLLLPNPLTAPTAASAIYTMGYVSDWLIWNKDVSTPDTVLSLSYARTLYHPKFTTLAINKGGTNTNWFTTGKFVKYNGTKLISTTYDSLSFEPAITHATGYAKWTGSAWSFINETYSLSSHNHSGVYEPVFTVLSVSKGGSNNAGFYNDGEFLKFRSATQDFASSGYSSSSFALSGHNHSGVYEPVFSVLGISKGGTNTNWFTTGKFVKFNGTKLISTGYDSTSYALTNQTMYIGTTAVAINRGSGALALTGITSIDGNASTVTNGVYTSGSYANPSWITSLSASKVLPSYTGNIGKSLIVDPFGTGVMWADMTESFIVLADNTTNNVSSTKHGFFPKLPNTGTQFYRDDGTWQTVSGGLSGSGTTNEIAYFTGSTSLGSLTTATYPSLTELSYVKGVTSAIQSQINGKQATITGGATTIVSSNLASYYVLVSDVNGKVATSPVVSTELFTPAYGELYDNVATSTIACDGTNYVKWNGSTVGSYKGVTGSTVNDNLTIDTGQGGVYRITYNISFRVDAADTYYWTVNISGTPQNQAKNRVYISATAVDYNISGSMIATLSATNTIDLGCYATNGRTVTVSFANLNVVKISN